MTDFYDEKTLNIIDKHVKVLEKLFSSYDYSKKTNEEILHSINYDFGSLLVSTAMIGVICHSQMKRINKIENAISKLPNTDEFKAVKEEVSQLRDETLSSLVPIKKFAESVEESKNKKVGYIG